MCIRDRPETNRQKKRSNERSLNQEERKQTQRETKKDGKKNSPHQCKRILCTCSTTNQFTTSAKKASTAMVRLLSAVVVAAIATRGGAETHNSTCGLSKVVPPGCEHADLGSCGNACCVVNVTGIRAANSTVVYDTLVSYLKSGGEDGSFTYVTGPDSSGNNPEDDLREYGIAWDYILQGTHTTYPGKYRDTIDLAIYKGEVDDDGTGEEDQPKSAASNKAAGDESFTIRAFNIANIHGALGDHGQSYKSLDYLVEGAFGGSSKLTRVFGCGLSS